MIHTVGPIYYADPNPKAYLRSAYRYIISFLVSFHGCGLIFHSKESKQDCYYHVGYRNSLSVAKENKIQYIAFPAISCGVYRYVDSIEPDGVVELDITLNVRNSNLGCQELSWSLL